YARLRNILDKWRAPTNSSRQMTRSEAGGSDGATGGASKPEIDQEALREPITKANCGAKLKLVQAVATMSRRDLAKLLGVSEGTLRRLESEDSEPTDDFMGKLQALCLIGVANFRKMSAAEREQVTEILGAGGGVIAGIGGALGAVGAAGSVAGFSAAGITSGLAAIGGGAMLAGGGIVANIPVAAV